jgi:LPS export ABC transporter permease LptG/LPS export ABC transporter permease LptF
MLRILDRYTIREVIPPFLLALVVFTFMLMMGPIERDAQALLAKGVSVAVTGRLLALLVPQALAVTIPMAFLLGLLVAFGRLSGDSEWVAMQACGVGMPRMLVPVLLLSAVAWGSTQWVMIVAVPWCNQTYREIAYGLVATRVETEIKPRIFFDDFPNMVLYTRDTPRSGPGWIDVFVADTSRQGPPQVTVAPRGRMLVDRAKHRVQMELENPISYSVTTNTPNAPPEYQANPSGSMNEELDPNKVFPQSGPSKGEPEKNIAELQQEIADLRQLRQATERPEYYLHQKFSIPVACVVFALLGLGLGVSSSRGGKLAAFALGTGVIFVYYVVMFEARSLSLGGVMPAWLAAWLPNMVLGPLGAVVVFGRSRSSGRSFLPSSVGSLLRLFRRDGEQVASMRVQGASGGVVVVVRVPHLGLPKPGILDRYISKSYARLQLLTFASLLGVFYISTFIDLSDKLFKGKTTADLVLRYFYFQTPQFVYYVLPLSVLIAALVTVGALTRNSELIVMKACGVSLYRAALPLVAFGMLSGLLLFGLEEYVLASSNRQAMDLDHEIRFGTARVTSLQNRRWVVGRNGEIFHYMFLDPRRGVISDLTRYEFDHREWRLTGITFIASATFDRASYTADSPTGRWSAAKGWSLDVGPGGVPRAYTPFSNRVFTFEPPDYFGSEQPEAVSMTYGELKQYIDSMQGSGLNILQPLVDLHRKISFPFVTLVMTLIAVPFAASTGRRGAMYGIGVGIVIAIVYWTATNLFGLVGSVGLIAPVLAAWAPNLLFGAVAGALLLTVRT